EVGGRMGRFPPNASRNCVGGPRRVFEGSGTAQYRGELEQRFGRVRTAKPLASREESREVYLVCCRYYGTIRTRSSRRHLEWHICWTPTWTVLFAAPRPRQTDNSTSKWSRRYMAREAYLAQGRASAA
ncbi:unnamed protein product, partial [Prorocentrum cordatum]